MPKPTAQAMRAMEAIAAHHPNQFDKVAWAHHIDRETRLPALIEALDSLVHELRDMEALGEDKEYDARGYDLQGCLRQARAALQDAEGSSDG